MHCLRLHCQDRPGIVAAVANSLAESGCNIEESSQFHDPFSGHFFMRVIISPVREGAINIFHEKFQKTAPAFSMSWSLMPCAEPVKTLILVSKEDHCLHDLLYRSRTQQLNIDITGIVSNHTICRTLAEERDIPFHYLPVSADTKTAQEQALSAIISETGSELIVLARYMQILSHDFCTAYKGRIINIHHSFLPGFKGARPYHQAYERGVKIIGATAHFATQDLDEGPIIEQKTERIDHSFTPEKMQTLGRDTESRTLARAIELYAQRRIFLHQGRTVIL